MSEKKFKVGDRVRFTSRIDESLYGVEGVVSFVSAEGFVTFTPDGVSNSSGGWLPGRFERIDLAPKFKVGDRVTHKCRGRGAVIGVDNDGDVLVRYEDWACGHSGGRKGRAFGVPEDAKCCWWEVVESLTPAPKFKVGDRVVDNRDLGNIGEVTMLVGGKYAVRWDCHPSTGVLAIWEEDRLDPAPPVLPAVDDFVRVEGSGYGRVTGVETPAPKVLVEFGDGTPVPVDPAEVRILGKSPVAA